MAEAVMLALRDIAYLAMQAESVADRQRLDVLMQSTATYVETRLSEIENVAG